VDTEFDYYCHKTAVKIKQKAQCCRNAYTNFYQTMPFNTDAVCTLYMLEKVKTYCTAGQMLRFKKK